MIECGQMKTILFTGGSGLLGSELKKHFQGGLFPTHKELDITDRRAIQIFFKKNRFDIVVHLAAFISPPQIDKDPRKALEVNIIGTANLVAACMEYKKKIIYMSTDYVFKGDRGNYSEEDALFPVNKYAWSKLGGECAVRLYNNHLIIRTSFGTNIFPYKKAFTDQWTSREPVSKVAKKIAILIKSGITGTIHIGGTRKTVFEYAKALTQEGEIEPTSRKDIPFTIPKDTSLNQAKYSSVFSKLHGNKKK